MTKEVVIDTEECIGCEGCVEVCPEVLHSMKMRKMGK